MRPGGVNKPAGCCAGRSLAIARGAASSSLAKDMGLIARQGVGRWSIGRSRRRRSRGHRGVALPPPRGSDRAIYWRQQPASGYAAQRGRRAEREGRHLSVPAPHSGQPSRCRMSPAALPVRSNAGWYGPLSHRRSHEARFDWFYACPAPRSRLPPVLRRSSDNARRRMQIVAGVVLLALVAVAALASTGSSKPASLAGKVWVTERSFFVVLQRELFLASQTIHGMTRTDASAPPLARGLVVECGV